MMIVHAKKKKKKRVSGLVKITSQSFQDPEISALNSKFSNLHVSPNDLYSTIDAFSVISWEKIASLSIPIIKEVPFNFRLALKECWSYTLRAILDNPNNDSAWKCLFLIPTLLLRRVSKNSDSSSLNSSLKARFDFFTNRNFALLLQNLLLDDDEYIPRNYSQSQQNISSLNFSRVNWLSAEGSPSKALSTLISSKVVEVNERSLNLMTEKHPFQEEKAFCPDFSVEDDLSNENLDPEICLLTLKSFDRATGAGPSQIRVSHLLDCISAEPRSDPKLLKLFSKVLTLLFSGKAPREISSFVSGARLVALEKSKILSDGLPDLRPIAVGELLRRWVGKILIFMHRSRISEHFHPYQLGVGVKCGSEIIYKAVERKLRFRPDLVLLQVDLTNAFNLCDRSTFLKQLQAFPAIFRWTQWVYGSHPWLFFGNNIIPSAQGVQQGDPLGPFLFAITLHPVILKIQELFNNKLSKIDIVNLWFLDDGNLVLPLYLVPEVLKILQSTETRNAGLFLNISKSCLFSLHWNHLLSSAQNQFKTKIIKNQEWLIFPEHQIPIERSGVTLLGSPLGSSDYIELFIQNCLNHELKNLLEKLKMLPDLHVSFYLWKFCAGFCRISSLMRALPPSYRISEPFKELCIDMFSHFFGGHYSSDLTLVQAAISPSLGGFGLRFYVEYHSAAYISSLIQCFSFLSEICAPNEIVSFQSEIEDVYTSLSPFKEHLPPLNNLFFSAKIQSILSSAIDKAKFENLFNSKDLSVRDKARLMGCSTKFASSWMTCPPNKKKGNFLDNQSLSLLLKYWFGLPIFARNSKCHCGALLDKFGDHAIHCKKKGKIIKRHDHVRDVLFSFLQTASIPAKKEVVGYFAGKKSRVGDLVLPFGGTGLDTNSECLYDISILSSLYNNRLTKSSEVRESTAELAVDLKLKARKADEKGIIDTSCGKRKFIPLGFESFGGFSNNSKKFIDFIAMEWSLKSGFDKALAKQVIISKVAVAIQRGNSLCLSAASLACLNRNLDDGNITYPD
jgi:hypothetical protein